MWNRCDGILEDGVLLAERGSKGLPLSTREKMGMGGMARLIGIIYSEGAALVLVITRHSHSSNAK